MRLLLLALVTVGCTQSVKTGGSGGQVASGNDGGVAGGDGGDPMPDMSAPPRKPPRPSPIAAENQLPGSSGWKLTAKSAGLYGFADRQSYAPGDTVQVHAAADAATSARWELYRMGYYGGALGRLVASGGPVALPQATPAMIDSSTGMVWAPWPTTFTIGLDGAAVTGVYLVKLVTASAQSYVIFVVREPAQAAPIAWPVAFNTYQAYNAWGGTGLYDNHRSDWSAAHAFKVSFDRPYEQGDGAGQYFFADRDFTTFAESQGYDIDYLADTDLDTDPHVLAGRALVVLQGHTEYWTADERTAVDGAVTDGSNLVVFGANDLYWQVRYEPVGGNPRRILVGYKDYVSLDPFQTTDPTHVTDQWRNLGQAENGLIGVMFGEWLWSAAPLVVDDPSSWLWSGADMKPGAFIPGFCGFEIDRRFANGNEPAGLAEIGHCNGENHQAQLALGQSTIYTAPSGATVFASGTVSWSQALAARGQWDPRVQQATHNLFARLAGVGKVGEPPAALSLPPGLPAPAQVPGVVVSTVTTALTSPTALAMAPSGDVIVADGNRIVRVTPSTGAVTLVAGGSAAGIADGSGAAAAFNQPRGLAVAADGTIYVADTLNHKIRKIVGDSVTTIAGSTEGFADGTPGKLDTPTAVVLTASGTLLIADPWNNRIRALPAAGGALSTWAGSGTRASVDGPGASAQFYFPFALTLLADGSLAVAESNDGVIRRVATDAAHTVSTWAGALGRVGWADGPMDQASFQEMINLATRPSGDVVVLDNATYRVRLIAGGQMTTLAGGATASLVDGDGGAAGFAFPRAAAFADNNTLYVADNGNHALRRLRLP